jgi:tetratricopeptide (TPR) repeat protein
MIIGAVYADLDQGEDAIRAYEEVLKRQSQPAAAETALAALHLAAGSLDKAMSYARQALTISRGNPLARMIVVRTLLAQRDLGQAKVELASLAKDFPNSPTVLNLVAAQQLANHEVEAARASYTRVVQAAPYDVEATAALTELDLRAGRSKEAIARVEHGLTSTSQQGDFLMLAAETYAAAGNPAKAEELLLKAIDVDPARLRAYSLLGGLYISQKRLDDAKDQFKHMVERSPKSVGANTMLGMLLEAQQRLPEAEQQYLKVLGIDSQSAVAANNLAWLYVSSNRNLDKALQLAQTAQSKLVDEPNVNDTLGWIYYRKNMTAEAIRHLEMSAQKLPNEPSTHYHLGMAYYQAGELDKAKKELQRSLAMKADFDGAADARKTLSQIGS